MVDFNHDITGRALEEEHLPKRIRLKKNKKAVMSHE